jgi:hypothetical protein
LHIFANPALIFLCFFVVFQSNFALFHLPLYR